MCDPDLSLVPTTNGSRRYTNVCEADSYTFRRDFSDFVVRLREPDGRKLKRAGSQRSGNSHIETSRCNAHRKPSVHVRRVLGRRAHEEWGYDFRDISVSPMSRKLISFSQRE